MCGMNLGLHYGLVPIQKTLSYSPWTSLWSRPKIKVPWSFKGLGSMPFGVDIT